jgi:hypothetical protein
MTAVAHIACADAGYFSNKSRPSALVGMPKTGPSSAGPMRTQPLTRDSIQQTQPFMPSEGRETTLPDRPSRTSASRAGQVDAAKAKISRRNSLRKQRDALKN